MKYSTAIVAAILMCFALQAFALRAAGGRTAKSESNFFSSIGRIQAGMRGEPRVMLLGSSITGRLPDQAQGFEGVANMGCDGGSAADALRAIHEGRIPRPQVIFVEANALPVARSGQSEVASAMRRPWFMVGAEIPALSAYARPAAFFYSALLAGRTGGFGSGENGDLGVVTSPAKPESAWHELVVSMEEENIALELAGRIADLRGKGTRVIVVWLPPARSLNSPPPAWVRLMVAKSGAEWWDIGQDAEAGRIRLTDGVHMDAESAARTVRTLVRGVK